MTKKFKLGKDALILSILTLITALSWIGFEVYRAAIETVISQTTKEQMAPLNPKIKREIFENLKNNLSFEEEELNTVALPSAEEELLVEIEEESTGIGETGSSQ